MPLRLLNRMIVIKLLSLLSSIPLLIIAKSSLTKVIDVHEAFSNTLPIMTFELNDRVRRPLCRLHTALIWYRAQLSSIYHQLSSLSLSTISASEAEISWRYASVVLLPANRVVFHRPS